MVEQNVEGREKLRELCPEGAEEGRNIPQIYKVQTFGLQPGLRSVALHHIRAF